MVDRIELGDGIIAILGENDIFSCIIAWLGREITVELYACEVDSNEGVESIKRAFDKFWNNKSVFLKQYQNDIIEKLLPYIAENESPASFLPYPKVTEEDFYADYWLSNIYIMTNEGFDEMQFFFNKTDGSEEDNCLSVNRYLDNGDIVSFTAGLNDIYPSDLGI